MCHDNTTHAGDHAWEEKNTLLLLLRLLPLINPFDIPTLIPTLTVCSKLISAHCTLNDDIYLNLAVNSNLTQTARN